MDDVLGCVCNLSSCGNFYGCFCVMVSEPLVGHCGPAGMLFTAKLHGNSFALRFVRSVSKGAGKNWIGILACNH